MDSTTTAEQSVFDVRDITVNINTVDRPDYLQACLRSLLETTPPGVPLQIVFNGTLAQARDRTIEEAGAWPGPTNFIILETTLPVADSHNKALEAIRTPLVNFMGDDDVVLGNRLPLLADAFNNMYPTPVAVTSYARRIAGDAMEPKLGSFKELGPTTVDEYRRWHASGEPFEMLWPGSVLDVAALRSIGGFESKFGPTFDTRIFSQLSFVGPVVSISDRQFGFRIHQGSMSTSNWKRQKENLRLLRACHLARLAGAPEPTVEEFAAEESTQSRFGRVRRDQFDRAEIMFRKGGEQWLTDRKPQAAAYMLGSLLSSPSAFFHKLRDQHR